MIITRLNSLAALTIAAVASAGLVACGQDNDGQGGDDAGDFPSLKLRMESPVGLEFPWSQILVRFSAAMAERTDGAVEIEVFPNLELSGDNVTQFENIQKGTIDGAVVNSQPLTAFDDRLNVFSLPFLAETADQYYELLDGPGRELWADALEKLDVVGIPDASTMDGFRQLTNSGDPVDSVEDLQGMTIRTPGLPLYVDIFDAVGANPTSIPFGELAGALQQGVVDGQENPLATIKAGGFMEFQDSLTLWNYSNSAMVFAFNQETWDEAGEEVQQIMTEEAIKAATWHRQTVSEANDEILEEFKQAEAFEHIIEFDEQDYETFRAAMEPVLESWSDRLGADVVDPFLSH